MFLKDGPEPLKASGPSFLFRSSEGDKPRPFFHQLHFRTRTTLHLLTRAHHSMTMTVAHFVAPHHFAVPHPTMATAAHHTTAHSAIVTHHIAHQTLHHSSVAHSPSW